MQTKLFVLLVMLFAHIVDDYYLQGVLASMKQKDWWRKNSPGEKYKYDCIAALFMHASSWTFMTMLPVAIYLKINLPVMFFVMLVANCVVHFGVDDLKANFKKINLVQDQLIHVCQIVLTWIVMVM